MTVRALAASFALALATQPASALTFNFSQIAADSLSPGQSAAFQAAASAWSAAFTDPITVNLQVGFRSLGGTTLGGASPQIVSLSATAVKTLLGLDRTSANDATAAASLPNYGPFASLTLTTAQARAIGFVGNSFSPAVDAVIEFSSDYSFSTSRNADGTIAAGTYDLIGIAEHEIGHALGFLSNVDYGGSATVLDQFRYGSAGVRSDVAGASAYFSINGGNSNLAAFSPGGTGNYQASHWADATKSGGVNALMDPAIAAGSVQNLTALDLEAYDVIGYDLAVAVAEPASLLVLVAGLLGSGLARRRRSAA